MDPLLTSSLISAGTSLLGGLFSSKSSKNAVSDANAANYSAQKEFAQHGIRWKVEDAKAAGIHPLYAVGAQGASFSPSYTVGDTGQMGSAVASAGQDIGRAIDATRTQGERITAYEEMAQALNLQKLRLENESLRQGIESEKINRSRSLARDVVDTQFAAAQMAKLRQGANPPMPDVNQPPSLFFDGSQGSSKGLLETVPLERSAVSPTGPSSEPGAIAEVGWVRTPTGVKPVPSKDVKNRIEDMPLMELDWWYRNNLLPEFGLNRTPPGFDPPPGYKWKWNWWASEWQPEPLASDYR